MPAGMDGLRNPRPLGLELARPPPPHPQKKNLKKCQNKKCKKKKKFKYTFFFTSLTKQSVWNNDTGAEQTT